LPLITLLDHIATSCNLVVASLLLQILLHGALNMNQKRHHMGAIKESDDNLFFKDLPCFGKSLGVA
jgi:hypothetical protein